MTEAARLTLEFYDFGVGVPFNSNNFRSNLAKAYYG